MNGDLRNEFNSPAESQRVFGFQAKKNEESIRFREILAGNMGEKTAFDQSDSSKSPPVDYASTITTSKELVSINSPNRNIFESNYKKIELSPIPVDFDYTCASSLSSSSDEDSAITPNISHEFTGALQKKTSPAYAKRAVQVIDSDSEDELFDIYPIEAEHFRQKAQCATSSAGNSGGLSIELDA
jgi:hypothetical protein